jgi:hypothetical protein
VLAGASVGESVTSVVWVGKRQESRYQGRVRHGLVAARDRKISLRTCCSLRSRLRCSVLESVGTSFPEDPPSALMTGEMTNAKRGSSRLYVGAE